MPITYGYEGQLAGRLPAYSATAGYLQGMAQARQNARQMQLQYDQMQQQRYQQQQQQMQDRWMQQLGHGQSMARIEAQGRLNEKLQRNSILARREDLVKRHGLKMDEMEAAARIEHEWEQRAYRDKMTMAGEHLRRQVEKRVNYVENRDDLTPIQKQFFKRRIYEQALDAPQILQRKLPGDRGTLATSGDQEFWFPEDGGAPIQMGELNSTERNAITGRTKYYANGEELPAMSPDGTLNPNLWGQADMIVTQDRNGTPELIFPKAEKAKAWAESQKIALEQRRTLAETVQKWTDTILNNQADQFGEGEKITPQQAYRMASQWARDYYGEQAMPSMDGYGLETSGIMDAEESLLRQRFGQRYDQAKPYIKWARGLYDKYGETPVQDWAPKDRELLRMAKTNIIQTLRGNRPEPKMDELPDKPIHFSTGRPTWPVWAPGYGG